MASSISMQLIGNTQQPPMMTCLDFEGQRWKVKVTAGRRAGESIHVDCGCRSLFSRCEYDL